MKIIPSSAVHWHPPTREEFLDREFLRLQRELVELGFNEVLTFRSCLPLLEKGWTVSVMEMSLEHHSKMLIEEAAQEESRLTANNSFTSFLRLPIELRLKIWELALPPQNQPRIHCVNERKSSFISNQPISPLLHVCNESRTFYLSYTQATFAFETYFSPQIDIIYIPDLANREEAFLDFLECESASKVGRFALRNEFFCNLPGEGHMSEKDYHMRRSMPNCSQFVLVFDDERSTNICWRDLDMRFEPMSARQRRKKAERGYARQYTKVLNGWSDNPVVYEFVLVREPGGGC